MNIPLPQRPQPDEAGGLSLNIGSHRVSLQPAPRGWTYSRPGLVTPMTMPADTPDRLRASARLGSLEAVIRLEPAQMLLPDEQVELWVPWPLEVVLSLDTAGGQVEFDALRCFRRTMVGPVDTGRVLPMAIAAAQPAPHAGEAEASLHIHAINRAHTPVQLRRVLIDERALALWSRQDQLVAGDVSVTVRADSHAEASSAPGTPPEGWTLRSAPAHAGGSALAWLLDATRRSVEYQL